MNESIGGEYSEYLLVRSAPWSWPGHYTTTESLAVQGTVYAYQEYESWADCYEQKGFSVERIF